MSSYSPLEEFRDIQQKREERDLDEKARMVRMLKEEAEDLRERAKELRKKKPRKVKVPDYEKLMKGMENASSKEEMANSIRSARTSPQTVMRGADPADWNLWTRLFNNRVRQHREEAEEWGLGPEDRY